MVEVLFAKKTDLDTHIASSAPHPGVQPLDATLTAFAALSGAADQLPYFTGADAFALTTLTPIARTVLDDTTTAAMLTTLGAASLVANTFTGVQTLPAGTEAAPALAVGEAGTGLYRQSAGVLGVVASGVDVMRFNTVASGVNFWNVIATTAGNAPILAVGGDDSTLSAIIRSKGDATSILFQNGSSENIFRVRGVTGAARSVEIVAATSGGTAGLTTDGGDLNLDPATDIVRLSGTAILGTRKTGWTAATGTATRTTFVTSTVTTEQLAERVKALLDDLISHGLIGT